MDATGGTDEKKEWEELKKDAKKFLEVAVVIGGMALLVVLAFIICQKEGCTPQEHTLWLLFP